MPSGALVGRLGTLVLGCDVRPGRCRSGSTRPTGGDCWPPTDSRRAGSGPQDARLGMCPCRIDRPGLVDGDPASRLPPRPKRVFSPHGNADFWVDLWERWRPAPEERPAAEDFFGNPVIVLALWPLYVLLSGQFFGQVVERPHARSARGRRRHAARRCPVAATALLFRGAARLADLVRSGCCSCLTTRLVMEPWIASRLYAAKPRDSVSPPALAVVGHKSGGLPVASSDGDPPMSAKPFDLKAFLASLPPPERNEAGLLLQKRPAPTWCGTRDMGAVTLYKYGSAKEWIKDWDLAVQLGWNLRLDWFHFDEATGTLLDRFFCG